MAITHSRAADGTFTPQGKIAWESEHIGSLSFTSADATDVTTFFTWQPATSGRGPFVMTGYEALFNGTRDPVLGLGYNAGATGAAIVSGEQALGFFIEGNYNDGSGSNKMELYFQYLHSDATATRPFFIAMNRTTGKVHSLSLKSDAGILFKLEDGANESGTTAHTFGKNTYEIAGADTTANSSITIRAASSRASAINMQHNGLTKLQFICDAVASATIVQNSVTVLNLFSAPNGGAAAGAISVGVADNSAAGVFDTVNATNSVASLIARAKSSQTAITFQVQDSSSNVVFGVNRSGLTAVGGATLVSTTALVMPAGTTAISPMRIPHGSAPTSPVDGDMWTTTSGLFVRINGGTVGPLS